MQVAVLFRTGQSESTKSAGGSGPAALHLAYYFNLLWLLFLLQFLHTISQTRLIQYI